MPDLRDHWDFSDPALSRERFSDLLKETVDPDLFFEISCQVVRTFSLERRFDEAHRKLDEVYVVYALVSDRAKASYHLERGRTFNSANQKKEAYDEFLVAAETHSDDLRVDAFHMLAISAKDLAQAEEWNLRAIELARLSNDPKANRWRPSLLNNLAWTLHDRGETDKALPLFQEALSLREEAGDSELIRVAKWSVARCLRSLRRINEALEIQLSICVPYENPFNHEELGEIYLALGQRAKASYHFAIASGMLQQESAFAEDHAERLERIRLLAQQNPSN